MVDLSRCPKTVALLEASGLVLEDGKPQLTEAWQEASLPHLRGKKREHKVRQEAVRGLGGQPEATAFLGWVLLTDPWRHVRAEAVQTLTHHATEPSQALIALALADRSRLVVRAAEAALRQQGGLTAFRVLVALWEDRGIELEVLHGALLELARRAPQPVMRQALPKLELEARKFFILPTRRRQLRQLAEALDQATTHLKDLPLTATASTQAENLPLPYLAASEGQGGFERVGSGGWVRQLFQRFKS